MHLIYCDDPPAADKGGLSSVLGAILSPGLRPVPVQALVGCASTHENAIGLSLLSTRGVRLNPLLRLPFLLIDALIVCARLRSSGLGAATSMCIWVGNDWTSLLRGLIVSRALGIRRPDIYVVDDLFVQESPDRRMANAVGQIIVKEICRRSGTLNSISANLATELNAQVGGAWKELPLPYRLDEHVADFVPPRERSHKFSECQRTRHIVFVGGLAPSVLEPLERISRAVAVHNAKPGVSRLFHLNVVSNSPPRLLTAFSKAANLNHLTIHRSISDADLRILMPSNAIFIAPYSESSICKNIVLNSFPSKILKAVSLRFPVALVVPPYAGVLKSHGKWIPCFDIKDAELNLDYLYNKTVRSRPWECAPLLYNHSLLKYLNEVSNV